MITRGITTIKGRAVDAARLSAGNMAVTVLSYGAVTQTWRIGDRSIVLGYEDPADYAADPYYHGAICGRVANRIRGGRFVLDGHEVQLPVNNGPNALHGGPEGISKQHWTMEADQAANAVRLAYVSADGESGYPGRAAFEVVVSLTDTQLTYDMRAEVDRPTPISLAQHNYYNLTGGEIWDHVVTVPADAFLVADEALIQTGERRSGSGTQYDLRVPRPLSEVAPNREMMDACLVLTGAEPGATLTAPGAPTLTFLTDQPGMHVYNANTLAAPFAPFTAFCLEPEHFPDAVNHPEFPSVIARPDKPYAQRLTIEVA